MRGSKKRKKIDTEEIGELIVEALQSVNTTNEEKLTYEKTWDTRRDVAESERLGIEREKLRIEREEVEFRRKCLMEDRRDAKLKKYRELRDSDDPFERELARKLADEIREEQGL